MPLVLAKRSADETESEVPLTQQQHQNALDTEHSQTNLSVAPSPPPIWRPTLKRLAEIRTRFVGGESTMSKSSAMSVDREADSTIREMSSDTTKNDTYAITKKKNVSFADKGEKPQ